MEHTFNYRFVPVMLIKWEAYVNVDNYKDAIKSLEKTIDALREENRKLREENKSYLDITNDLLKKLMDKFLDD